MENQKRKSTWSLILKVIIAVATAIGSVTGNTRKETTGVAPAIGSVIGIQSCI